METKRLMSPVNRRQALRGTVLLMSAGLISACTAGTREPAMRFAYPDEQGARIQDNPVPFRVAVRNFPLFTESRYRSTEPGAKVVFFIDTPADAVADGQPIPNDPAKFVPASAPPFDAQAIELQPGVRTITAVMVDAQGNKLPLPAPVSVTVFVQPSNESVR